MKPINFGSTFLYNMVAVIVLCISACIRSINVLAQLIFVGIIGVSALALIAHSTLVLVKTSSDSNRKTCKLNILYACVYVAAALVPFAAEKVLYEWAAFRIGSIPQ